MATDEATQSGLLKAAIESVPVVKYALGLAAIAILVSIARGANPDIGLSGMAPVIVGTLVLMVLLILVAAISETKSILAGPATLMTWSASIALVVVLAASVSAMLIGWPPQWAHLILPQIAADNPLIAGKDQRSPLQKPPPSPIHPDVAPPAVATTIQTPAPAQVRMPALDVQKATAPASEPEQTVFVDRVVQEGTEVPACAAARNRSTFISGTVESPYEIQPLDSDCKVKIYFDVHATKSFDAPFKLTFFNGTEEGGGNQILSATVNKLPNRFMIDLGRIDRAVPVTMYVYQPGHSGGSKGKERTTLVGKVDVAYGRVN